MRNIDLNDWIESGGGARGTSYFNKGDKNLMLKFDNLITDPSSMEQELQAARSAYALGISTPEPGELVSDGRRFGITFRRIPGKVSYARAIGDNPERLEELASEFARQVRILHSTQADLSAMKSIKDIYGNAIRANKFHEAPLIERALALLEELPEADTCVHGDLHIGNIILAEGKSYFIDMGNFSYGCPMFDLAMMKAVSQLAGINPGLFREMFHFDAGMAGRLWELFITDYSGPGKDVKSVEEELKPYLAIRKLTMETETGQPLQEEALRGVYDVL